MQAKVYYSNELLGAYVLSPEATEPEEQGLSECIFVFVCLAIGLYPFLCYYFEASRADGKYHVRIMLS